MKLTLKATKRSALMPKAPMRNTLKLRCLLGLAGLILLIQGCGQKGDLYLPGGPEPTPVTVSAQAPPADGTQPGSTAESAQRKKTEKSAEQAPQIPSNRTRTE